MLVDYLIAKTMEREAFSPVKQARLNLDVEAAMRAHEAEIVSAASEQELFYALSKLSNARRDRHLSVFGIEGGLAEPKFFSDSGENIPTAPVRVEADYSSREELRLFIVDIATDTALTRGARTGDRVLAINGEAPSARIERARPYFRFSTEIGFLKKFAEASTVRTGLLPPEFYATELQLKIETGDGNVRSISLPYLAAGKLQWDSERKPRYPGFTRVADRGAFDVYEPTDGREVVLLDCTDSTTIWSGTWTG